MPTAPSFQDLLDQGLAEAQSRRPDLQFAEGDVSLAILHGAGAMGDATIRFGSQAFRDTFIDGATGDALSILVDDHLNIQRQFATAAQVTVTFSRTSGGAAGSISANTGIATGFNAKGQEIQFLTLTSINVPLGNNGPFTTLATAVIAGRDGNVAAGTINRITDSLFDTTFAVTNVLGAGGGNDEETDEALRERARNFFSTLRRGTLAALEYGALQVPSVRVAVAIENTVTGITIVRVSDSDGNSSSQMVADVTTELENWRVASSVVTVVGGAKVLLDISAVLTVRPSFDVSAVDTLFQDAITNRIGKLRVGEVLYLDSLIAAIIAVSPDDVLDVTFTSIVKGGVPQSPTANVVADVSEVLRAGVVVVS
jgi:hypothetical protein